jgi:hypothetical protein
MVLVCADMINATYTESASSRANEAEGSPSVTERFTIESISLSAFDIIVSSLPFSDTDVRRSPFLCCDNLVRIDCGNEASAACISRFNKQTSSRISKSSRVELSSLTVEISSGEIVSGYESHDAPFPEAFHDANSK